MGVFLKSAEANIDYAVDWGHGYLGGASISASAWTVEPQEPGGVRVAAELLSATRTGASLADGQPGRMYRVVNRITLSDGRDDERALRLRVEGWEG